MGHARADGSRRASLGGSLFAAVLALALLTLAILTSEPLRAAEPAQQEAPAAGGAEVPGGDIFGFTASADVGKVGDHGAALEIDGSFGLRGGSYKNLSQKLAYERVIAPNTSFGVGLFTAWHSVRNVPAEPINRNAFQFDGVSFELAHRLVERSATNPFSFKIALEPRWARLTGGGRHTNAYGAELKLIVDAVVVPDTLFWAGNIVFDAARERDPEIKAIWTTGSGVKISNALTFQFSERVFAGAEVAYRTAFDGFFGRFAGHAVFAGPTVYWKIAENAALNATFAPQIAGRAKGVPQRLDLDNFERSVSRIKLAIEF